MLGGFGPVAKEGYGIGYGMDENNLLFNVTSYLQVSPFLEKLDESLKDMVQGKEDFFSQEKEKEKERKKCSEP